MKNEKSTGISRPSQVRLAKRRSRIYGILAAAFAGPVDETFLGLIRALKIPHDASLPVQNEQLSGGLSQLSRWLENNSAPSDSVLSSELEPEFTILFRGLSRRNSPLPPYESVYVEGRLFGDSTGKITEMFDRYSLKPGNNEPPDHISLELEFMRLLCQSESEAADSPQNTLREEAKFLEEHLLQWVPALCEQIRKFDSKGFYKGLADITEGWLIYDLALINHLLADSEQAISP